MFDEIGTSDMIQGSLTSFTTDRFGCENSALALNGGWTQTPNGVYFNTPEFTISTWVYPQSVGYESRVIDFGNTITDNIVLSLSSGNSLQPMSYICNYFTVNAIYSSQKLKLNQWQFLALTFNGSIVSIYLNGTLIANKYLNYTLPTLIRKNCYIGKGNYGVDQYSSSYLDDLKFYNKSLTQAELIQAMNENNASNENTIF